MIISGNTSISRPILRQAPAPYMDPLEFSFLLEGANFGNSFEFGILNYTGGKAISYNLKSGLVYDYSGRFVGTYQDGNNSFLYCCKQTGHWQEINNRLVSKDIYSGYLNSPFAGFYVSNYGSNSVEFDLNIKGFSPPTLYPNFSSNNLSSLTGRMVQSGLSENPGQEILYQVFDISIPSQYGSVTSFDSSGLGEIEYIVSGGSYSPDDVIPVTFDTYYGSYTVDISVNGAAGETTTGATGTFLTIYGTDNLIPYAGTAGFYVDYYSNVETPVIFELEVPQSETLARLSGSGIGQVTYEGYVNKTGNIFANGLVTGIADLFAPENLAYNTQYDLLDQYLNITQTGSFYSKNTPFIGNNTFSYTGVILTGIYDGPRPEFIGKTWVASGDVNILYSFASSDNGVTLLDADFEGFANPAYGNFNLLQGTGKIQYPYNVATFPTGIGYASINKNVTGQGFMSIVENTGFFGYGDGRVSPGATLVNAVSTGTSYYQGDINNWVYWEDYPNAEKPDFSSFPYSGGAIVECAGLYNFGYASVGGNTVVSTGELDPYSYGWGYATGPSIIHIGGNQVEVRRQLAIPFGSLTGRKTTGEPYATGFTGIATGYLQMPALDFNGPTFEDTRDISLTNYPGSNGLLPVTTAQYGRSCIFGDLYYTCFSAGIVELLQNPPVISFDIRINDFQAVYAGTLTGATEKIYIKDLFPYNGYSDNYLTFKQPIIYPSTGGIIFNGKAKVTTTGAVGVFNLKEGLSEYSSLSDYTALNWIDGNTFVRPIAETFPAEAASRYLEVSYVPTDNTSVGSAVLRVTANDDVQEILITGNGNGVR